VPSLNFHHRSLNTFNSFDPGVSTTIRGASTGEPLKITNKSFSFPSCSGPFVSYNCPPGANKKLPYILNILHVKQNGFIKRFGFGASNHLFTPGSIQEDELPILEKMFRHFVVSLKPFLPDKWEQEQYFMTFGR
jgi:hypothetical protein